MNTLPEFHCPRFPAICLAALLTTGLAGHVRAQTAPVSPAPAATPDEIVSLSVFEVSANQVGRYQADESASGGRLRTNVMSAPTTVSVLTREFIEDVGAGRVLDAAKYVAGVSEATIPNGLDRVNIRGFQSDGRRVDGFSTSDQANYDSAGIDRMEVTMGPDALLQPSGVPGGTINLVSKRPKFSPSGYVKVQAGQYDANRVEADTTGPLGHSKQLAYRVVTSWQDSKGYVERSYRKSFFVTPSFTWKLSSTAQFMVRYEYYAFKTHVGEGLPVDPSVGTNDAFKLFPGVARDFSPGLPDDDLEYRKVRSHQVSFLFTGSVTDHLSVRVAGRISDIDTPDRGFGWGLSGNGGARDPRTGLWVGGTVFGGAPTFTASPAAAVSHTFAHTGTDQGQKLRYRDLQNDWAYSIANDQFDSVTSAGFAYAFEHQNLQARAQTAKPFNIDAFVVDTSTQTFAAWNTDRRRELARTQFYIAEKLELLNKRLVLSAGATNLQFNGYFGNKLVNGGLMTPGSGASSTSNYGAVVKPRENISLYYGHSESAVPQANFEQVNSGAAPRFSVGTQNEFGVKVRLLDNRVLATVSHYEINQTGYSLANPANLTSPPPPVLLPALILTRLAKGWEYQVNAAISRQFSLIASYANTKNRDPNNIPFRSSAEKMGSGYARYEFTEGGLKGFSTALGLTWMDQRAGDVGSGYTAASTPTNLIPNQPSFYLPAQTLVDLNLGYTRGKTIYRVSIANLLDQDNYPAAGARNSVVIGNPRNISGSVTWKF